MMRHCPSQESLAGAGRSIQEHTLRLGNTQGLKQLRVLHWQLNDLLDLLDLFVQTSDHLVGGVRHLLHHHQRHKRVHLELVVI